MTPRSRLSWAPVRSTRTAILNDANRPRVRRSADCGDPAESPRSDQSSCPDKPPEANALLAEIGPHSAELQASGALVAAYRLNLPKEAITVSARAGGKTSTTDGPLMEAWEMLRGLVVIEARGLNDALHIAAGMAHAKIGHIEVRPAIDYSKPRPQL